ncbi:hypothetical protein JCGZ_22747 [Jatropha curcas]|uniref:Agglutinin domain-containing protein n=1 Tax=Jatropha curcas TaxID=180498 RepID=A0A067LFB2_JATCU|nr:uncharacterized protein LOC105628968 [Jatropha curcas]KDP43195.1 hypothetical protein JCGZ_22747 [Jatropha curcas]
MAPFIPRYSVFKSNFANNYLVYIDESGSSQYRYIRCDGTEIVSPFSKFRVEKATTSSALIHIRCCFSNKYWRRSSEGSDYIAAAADKAEEDQCNWSCTLFKPIQAGDDKTFRFQHVQLGNNVWFNRSDNDYRGCLIARYSTEESDGADLFTVINWDSLVILPKHVVFKGDNEKYLRYRGEGGDDHMEFGCDDIGSTKVANEIFYNFDGSIRVKLDENGKFWEATPNWIYPISTDTSATSATSFWPVKLGPEGDKDNIIALKNLGNDRFVRRTHYEGTVDCAAAASWATTIDKEAYLYVEEPLVSRKVYDVDFHLGDVRVYGEQIVLLASDEVNNKSDTEIKDSTLLLEYEDSRTSTYKTSTSVKTGIEMEFSASIPIIADVLDIGLSSKFSLEFGKKYAWGEEKKKTNTLSATMKVVVPPKTKVKVDLVATKGFCDVPFSYAQRDTLTNGKQITYIKDDGVYVGSNYYGFNFVVKEEKIGS